MVTRDELYVVLMDDFETASTPPKTNRWIKQVLYEPINLFILKKVSFYAAPWKNFKKRYLIFTILLTSLLKEHKCMTFVTHKFIITPENPKNLIVLFYYSIFNQF